LKVIILISAVKCQFAKQENKPVAISVTLDYSFYFSLHFTM